jgi:type 1 fimbriae regulatory protein FimE
MRVPDIAQEDPQSPFSAKSSNRPPVRRKNSAVRSREYLTPSEMKRIKAAASLTGRHGFRDCVMVTVVYRYALRVGEAVSLRWDQVDLNRGRLHVNRLKNGDPSVHYLEGDEIRSLRRLRREYPDSDFVFCSERQAPLTTRSVHHIVARAGAAAGIKFPVHPHMLRHAKGYQLAGRGEDTRAIQAYLGHRNIQHTVLYTKLDPRRFRGFGRD